MVLRNGLDFVLTPKVKWIYSLQNSPDKNIGIDKQRDILVVKCIEEVRHNKLIRKYVVDVSLLLIQLHVKDRSKFVHILETRRISRINR